MPRGRGRVTRFVVMAMLQAARAESLGLPLESAHSWGLNRAIFYAAAKRGFRGASGSPSTPSSSSTEKAPTRKAYQLGDDEAFQDTDSGKLLFIIGDHPQTEADFDHQIAERFGSKENFRAAWKEASKIVAEYDATTLASRRQFYEDVYKPRRDELSERWSREYGPSPEKS